MPNADGYSAGSSSRISGPSGLGGPPAGQPQGLQPLRAVQAPVQTPVQAPVPSSVPGPPSPACSTCRHRPPSGIAPPSPPPPLVPQPLALVLQGDNGHSTTAPRPVHRPWTTSTVRFMPSSPPLPSSSSSSADSADSADSSTSPSFSSSSSSSSPSPRHKGHRRLTSSASSATTASASASASPPPPLPPASSSSIAATSAQLWDVSSVSVASSASSARRRQRQRVKLSLPMHPASQPGMQNRLSASSSSSSNPSPPGAPPAPVANATDAITSTINATAVPTDDDDGSDGPGRSGPDPGPPAVAASPDVTATTPSSASVITTATNTNDRENTTAAARGSGGRRSTGSPAPSARSSAPSLPPSVPSPTPQRNSILSRLKLPISLPKRTRHVTDFYIQTDKPPRHSYSPGDHVRGTVHLTVSKPLRITHLTVALSGYVHVVKDASSGAKTSSSISSRLPHGGSEHPIYHGNGLASLFQDEQVLSGEGRLDVSKYQFGFDLVFPSRGLPSSISFGLGTIAYMITATLTRPTSIAPTTTCDRDVQLMDRIDIGQVRPPRPRPIFLEPISKRKRRKRSMAREKVTMPATPDAHDANSEAAFDERSVTDDASRNRSTIDLRQPDHSDIQSEVSGGSVRSASTGGMSRAELAQVASAKQQAVDDKTITATVEVLRGGCLPGDTIPVRVTVQHIERMKSMNGVIVTLFRRGKVDSSPSPSRFEEMADGDQRRLEMDEAHPRSRTNLGGLSLSSTSSTRLFRQDLDQALAPLIINPTTLQASVTVSVKLPERPFPTTIGVPGDMVAFRYYVEVLVDLKGRVWNQMGGAGQDSRLGHSSGGAFDGGGNSYSPRRGPHIGDTQALRNAKSVVAVSMEVIAGTTNSAARETTSARPRMSASSARTIGTATSEDDETPTMEHGEADTAQYGASPSYTNGMHSYQSYQNSHRHHNQSHANPGPSQPHPYHQWNRDETPAYVPPPQLLDHHNLSEKERLRQAETRLLPSQPGPAPDGPSQPPDHPSQASAPGEDSADGPSAPTHDGHGPSAPTLNDLSHPDHPDGGEDKQERERRRLLEEASSPPEFPEDMDRRQRGEAATTQEVAEPSAPVLDEHDDDEHQAGPSHSGRYDEQLPAYER